MAKNDDPKPIIPRYMRKILAEIKNRQLTPGVHVVTVKHDDDCPFLTGSGPCNCNPTVELPASLPGRN